MTRYARQQVQRNIDRAHEALTEARAALTLDDLPVVRMLAAAERCCDDATLLLDAYPDESACTTCGAPLDAQEATPLPGCDECPDCGALVVAVEVVHG